jgi:long-chain fatty acid transport protein
MAAAFACPLLMTAAIVCGGNDTLASFHRGGLPLMEAALVNRLLRSHQLGVAGIALGLALSAASAPASAQGFSVYEQGACAMGRAGAGVAAPCEDGSAIFFNPAGLASKIETTGSIGGTAIAPRGQFIDDTTRRVSALNRRTLVVPTNYFARPVGRRTMIGIGVFVPYGLTSDWPSTSQARFLGYRSSVRSVYVQPTVAVRVSDRILVGAGLDVTHVNIDLQRRLDLAAVSMPGAPPGLTLHSLGVPEGTDFADVDLEGSGTHAGAHIGVIVNANDRLSFGGRFLLRQRVNVNGQVSATQINTGIVLDAARPGLPNTPLDLLVTPRFASGQPLGAQAATTTLPLPDQVVMGVALRTNQRSRVFLDYQFTNWSLLDQVTIQYQFAPPTVLTENFHDSHGVFVGGEYALTPFVIRGGFAARSSAAPDQSVTPLLPDAPRWLYAAGASIPLRGKLRMDVAYSHVAASDRRGRTTDGGQAVPTASVNNGLYHLNGNLLGISFVLGF